MLSWLTVNRWLDHGAEIPTNKTFCQAKLLREKRSSRRSYPPVPPHPCIVYNRRQQKHAQTHGPAHLKQVAWCLKCWCLYLQPQTLNPIYLPYSIYFRGAVNHCGVRLGDVAVSSLTHNGRRKKSLRIVDVLTRRG